MPQPKKTLNKESKKLLKKYKYKKKMQLDDIQELLAALNIANKDWDILLVGDGSGSGWDIGCGWSCVLIDKNSARRKLFYGGMNTGTIGIAELFPYVHAMMWYAGGPGKTRLKELMKQYGNAQTLKVHVITDSEITAKQGQGDAKRKSVALWSVVDKIAMMGYEFKFHHMRRETSALNKLSDYLSKKTRKAVEEVELPNNKTLYEDAEPPDS